MAVGPQNTVLYPLGSRVLAAALIAICAVIEVSLVVSAPGGVTLRATPVVLLVAMGAYTLFWAPRVELSPSELRVVNPLRTHDITWPAICDIDTRWSLAVVTVRGRFTAWAAPSPGPLSQLGRMNRQFLRITVNARHQDSGPPLARALVQTQWEAYRDQGVLGSVEGEGVTTRWNVPLTAAVAVLTAATVAAAIWP